MSNHEHGTNSSISKAFVFSTFEKIYLISAQVKLFTSGNFNYYKVEVSNGSQMTTDTVLDTCQAAGLHAVCPGSSSCESSNPTCYATPLTPDGCQYLAAVSDHMCGTTDPKQCPAIDNMFVMMNNNWGGYGALGVVGNKYYAYGRDYVSGKEGQSYFAFCVRILLEDLSFLQSL